MEINSPIDTFKHQVDFVLFTPHVIYSMQSKIEYLINLFIIINL